VVKLVSSEGIGTIAVGVAKAGADVINVAGSTGGTGAAQVTSLKHTGRVAEIGITEVHQALSENGLRDKVILRCSNAHQTGMDVIKSAMMGGDSFEFGTTALMMLRCVMAKNCHIKCPAGLTTNPEVYDGDPRALAQYYINLAHEVREILASLGYKSLKEICGRSDLLHLVDHKSISGRLDMTEMLRYVEVVKVEKPVYLEANFEADDHYIKEFKQKFWKLDKHHCHIAIDGGELGNRNKTTGGQFSVDVERFLNYELTAQQIQEHPAVTVLSKGRKALAKGTVTVTTTHAAGQSFGAFNNTGITLVHTGTCNDGVGKSQSGGVIVVCSPGGGCPSERGNSLIGNFALFGATGGKLYVAGQAGDRFGVRNSGAVAVVEGVGDFCAEYMTNGSIVNLGAYGKGFGNGMSGGTAYQYDPTGDIANKCSEDSVTVMSLTADDEFISGQREALLHHLEEHSVRTGSVKVEKILKNWQAEVKNFHLIMPKALYNLHTFEKIVELCNRKQMIEELSTFIGESSLKKLKQAYDTNQPLLNGAIPNYGDVDSELIFDYIHHIAILHKAMVQATKTTNLQVNDYAKNLIVTLDRKLVEQLIKDTKEALKESSDKELSILLADKRINDYKMSLSLREVSDTQAFGTTVWIISRTKINAKALAQQESLTKTLAKYYINVLGEFIEQNSKKG